jgi:hypothetical protein
VRLAVIIAGTVVLLVSFLLLMTSYSDSSYLVPAIFAFILAGANLILGLLTRKSSGVVVPDDPSSPVKLSVDKAVLGPTIYTMAFSTKKLVLKRLSSTRITLLVALILAILGFAIIDILGAAMGGLTAFSIQEFITQNRRDDVERGNVLDSSGKGDLEFQYADVEKVELGRNRLRIHLKDKIFRIVISRKYPDKMRPVLVRVIGSLEKEDSSASAGKPSKE